MNILVTGMPWSGYEVVYQMLRNHQEGGQVLDVAKFHHRAPNRMDSTLPIFDNIRAGEFTHVLAVTRSEEAWLEQQALYGPSLPEKDPARVLDYADHCRMHYDTLRSCAGVPMMVVNCEDVMGLPEFTGHDIARFCGFEWKGWTLRVSVTI